MARTEEHHSTVLPTRPESLSKQLQRQDYDDLKTKKKDRVQEYEEELGADAAHALLAAGSGKELRAAAHFLRRFKPLRLWGVDRKQESDNANDEPKKAILLGRVQPGVPVLVALQPDYKYQPNDPGENRRADMLIGGIGNTTVRGEIFDITFIEFDFDRGHRNVGDIMKERQKDRREKMLWDVEIERILKPEHMDIEEMEETNVVRDSVAMNISKSIKSMLKYYHKGPINVYDEEDVREVPPIWEQPNVSFENSKTIPMLKRKADWYRNGNAFLRNKREYKIKPSCDPSKYDTKYNWKKCLSHHSWKCCKPILPRDLYLKEFGHYAPPSMFSYAGLIGSQISTDPEDFEAYREEFDFGDE